MKAKGVVWSSNTLIPRGLAYAALANKAVEEILEVAAEAVQQYAQANAPWEDQSGAARDGLVAEYESEGIFGHAIVLSHSVDYGFWLEIRWNGRYAIIIPTIEHMGPLVIGSVSNMHGGMG